MMCFACGEREATYGNLCQSCAIDAIKRGGDVSKRCAIAECDRVVYAKGLCRKHYNNGGKPSTPAKLTPEQIAEIRSSNETFTALATRFGVSLSYISLIKHRKRQKQTG